MNSPDSPVTNTPAPSDQQLEQLAEQLHTLRQRLGSVLIGQPQVIDEVLSTLFAGGHVLLESLPGLGKTLLVRALANCFNGQFKRIQFTPDLMPSDITGHAIFNFKSEQFNLRQGPVFTHFLLADEINRAPPKTQAALLEVMQERQVTLEGQTLPVPQPFMVLATQNPIELEGTYPLPEAQLDRFMAKIQLSYPGEPEEQKMVRLVTSAPNANLLVLNPPPALLQPVAVLSAQRITAGLPIADEVLEYAVRIVRTTRSWPSLRTGAGPRASIDLIRCARAHALLRGGSYVLPDDVKDCALMVLRHRVTITPGLKMEGLDIDQVLVQLLEQVAAPRP